MVGRRHNDNAFALSRVEDMHDGGMGSVRFLTGDQAMGAKPLAEAEYVDDDGVLVSIVINADVNGRLREIDFWKVDFSPLKRYPTPADLRIKPR
jgi:hypothetical protein